MINPSNWYYRASDGRIYSTADMAEVPADNASYVAFCGKGLLPSTWPGAETEADLRLALAAYGYPCGPITPRQFYQQCAVAGIISENEAVAVLSNGTLPAVLAAIVNALPSDQRFGAKMLLIGASQFSRTHPMTEVIGAAQGMTPAQIDAFFRAAAQL
jgi:hypothetical protein